LSSLNLQQHCEGYNNFRALQLLALTKRTMPNTAEANLRHGTLDQFLPLTDGLSVAKIAEILHCCDRSVRNWIAGRSPIPWHRVEILREWSQKVQNPDSLPADSALHDVVTDEEEQVAWITVHAPHFLSNPRAFMNYVRGWNVVEKIAWAKADGSWRAILRRWRESLVPRYRTWRTGPLFAGCEDIRFSRRE